MQELMSRTGTDYEEIGRALMTRSIGYLISALSAGILTDILNRYVEVSIETSGVCEHIILSYKTIFFLLIIPPYNYQTSTLEAKP